MRKLFIPSVAGFILASLCVSTAAANPTPAVSALGTVVQAEQARLANGRAASGATVFDGDRVATEAAGSLQLRFGSSQAYLSPGSSAVLRQLAGGFGADLTGGTIVASSAAGETFHVVAEGALIRPATEQPTVAQVTLVGPNEVLLASRRGALEVSLDGDVQYIAEGASYRMLLEADEAAAAQLPGGRSSRRMIFILIALAAAGTGIGLWRALRSPDAP